MELALGILGTGTAAGIVTFVLNVMAKYWEQKKRSRYQDLILSNYLLKIALEARSILEAYDQVGSLMDYEYMDEISLPEISLVQLATDYPAFDAGALSEIGEIELNQKVFEIKAEAAAFEAVHIVDSGFDKKLEMRKRVEQLFSETLTLAKKLRIRSKLEMHTIHSLHRSVNDHD